MRSISLESSLFNNDLNVKMASTVLSYSGSSTAGSITCSSSCSVPSSWLENSSSESLLPSPSLLSSLIRRFLKSIVYWRSRRWNGMSIFRRSSFYRSMWKKLRAIAPWHFLARCSSTNFLSFYISSIGCSPMLRSGLSMLPALPNPRNSSPEVIGISNSCFGLFLTCVGFGLKLTLP